MPHINSVLNDLSASVALRGENAARIDLAYSAAERRYGVLF